MSYDIVKLVQEIDSDTVDVQMALQCAPLLAGLKMSNMLSVKSDLFVKVILLLKETDISYYILRQTRERVVFLLYKEEMLKEYIVSKGVRKFLLSYGYTDFEIIALLGKFADRYCKNLESGEVFPHEMGIFLGYPLEDVKGFIDNQGQNSLYTGYWKVYADLSEKEQMFARFEKAREFMVKLISCGTGIGEIIDIFRYEELREAVL